MRIFTSKLLASLLFNFFVLSNTKSDVPSIAHRREVFELPPMIIFKKYSTNYLNALQEERLDAFFSNYKSLNNLDVKILLSYHSCKEEDNRDNFIGYKRSDKILAYGVRKWGIKRKSVFIRNISSTYINDKICEYPTVSISIIY